MHCSDSSEITSTFYPRAIKVLPQLQPELQEPRISHQQNEEPPKQKLFDFQAFQIASYIYTLYTFPHLPTHHNSSCPELHSPPVISGIPIILTTRLVQPVKCCVLCPLPVSGLYCSHAKPVSTQESKTVLMRFSLRREYRSVAFSWCGPGVCAYF